MKKTVLFSLVVFALLSVATLPNVRARGQMPLPPVFSGGNAGAWLGRGPVLLLDSSMIGPGFGSGGGGGIGTALFWDPDFGGTGGAGATGDVDCPGNCLETSWVGPCIQHCECMLVNRPDSMHTGGQGGSDGECIRIDGIGAKGSGCKKEYTLCIRHD